VPYIRKRKNKRELIFSGIQCYFQEDIGIVLRIDRIHSEITNQEEEDKSINIGGQCSPAVSALCGADGISRM
jgi:hypothetical protein